MNREIHYPLKTIQKNIPQVGHYLSGPTGTRYYEIVSLVWKASATRKNLYLRLKSIKKADLPAEATIHPWPARPTITPAATKPAPVRRYAIMSNDARAKAELARAVALLTDDEAGHMIPSIRTKTIEGREPTVEAAEWIDPADMNPNRRRPTKVHGFRTFSQLRTLRTKYGLITLDHQRAGQLFIQAYEIGELGARPGYHRELHHSSTNFASGSPPNELRMQALRNFRAAKEAAGRDGYAILEWVVLQNKSVTAYANGRGIYRKVAMGYLIAVLDRLVEHYEPELKRMAAGNKSKSEGKSE